jgi:pimeloyl-ACP methyl ester carboxylesterase
MKFSSKGDFVMTRKSTNVRFNTRWERGGFSALQSLSTALAASAASRLFLKTPPRPKSTARPITDDAVSESRVVGKQRLAVWTASAGTKTVLLVHGWGGRASQMRAFAKPLVHAGYRVVAFDAPGHGASSGTTLSLPDFAEVVRELGQAFGPLQAIVAHSFGAAASSLAIARGLHVERAVLIGSPAAPTRWFEGFSDRFGLSERTRRAAQERIERSAGEPFSSLAAEKFAPSLALPVLVVHDRLDREVPYEDGERIVRAAPAAELLTTEGLGHRDILRDGGVIAKVVAFVQNEPEARAETCRHCGSALAGTWEASGTLCLHCSIQHELADRTVRWDRFAA